MDFHGRCWRRASGRLFRCGMFVAPWHQPAWIDCNVIGIPQKNCYIYKSIETHEAAGVNETNKELSYPCASLGPIIQRFLSVADCRLNALSDIVIKGGAGSLRRRVNSSHCFNTYSKAFHIPELGSILFSRNSVSSQFSIRPSGRPWQGTRSRVVFVLDRQLSQ